MFTDNNPLEHFNSVNLGAAERRWVAQLANFNYILKCHPRKENSKALSWKPPEASATMAIATEEAERQEQLDLGSTPAGVPHIKFCESPDTER